MPVLLLLLLANRFMGSLSQNRIAVVEGWLGVTCVCVCVWEVFRIGDRKVNVPLTVPLPEILTSNCPRVSLVKRKKNIVYMFHCLKYFNVLSQMFCLLIFSLFLSTCLFVLSASHSLSLSLSMCLSLLFSDSFSLSLSPRSIPSLISELPLRAATLSWRAELFL